ncbi:MAG: DUF4129 domain-containing protein [Haloarculaceae archaeon]
MDGSRLDVRTVVLALLCLAALSFAAATLNSTTSSDTGLGSFGQADQRGGQQTPVQEPTGDGRGDRWAIVDLGPGGAAIDLCTPWLSTPLAHAAILLGLLGVFLLGRWYDDAAMGLGWATLVGYPGFFVYLLLTDCQESENGNLLDITSTGNPAQQGGGLFGGQGSTAPPSLLSQFLLVGVVVLLGAVAVLVLTGDHDQRAVEESGDSGEDADEEAVDVAAVGAAAGRAADRIEESADDEGFANEVYRAWAEMTESLTVDHPESSTPGEFAAAAVDAGMDREDVERLTRLFSDVRYGGEEPTPERESEAVETLRRIEAAYAEGES